MEILSAHLSLVVGYLGYHANLLQLFDHILPTICVFFRDATRLP